MIRYYKLFDLLNRRGMKKTDLLQVISAPALARLGKGDVVRSDSCTHMFFLGMSAGGYHGMCF